MTNSTGADGHVASPPSNLVDTSHEEFNINVYDGTADKIAKGYYGKHVNWHSDEEMAANLDLVQRNGSRIYANGGHQPGDIINVNGMEIQYQTAVELGLVTNLEGQGVSPREAFEADAENTPDDPETTAFEGAELLMAQLDMATGGNGENVMNTFAADIVENGGISEAGFEYAAKNLGMNEQVVREQFSAMQEVGGKALYEALETGDGMGEDRIDFLLDRYEHGNQAEQKLVRQMWLGAALGKMSERDMQQHFDRLYEPYK